MNKKKSFPTSLINGSTLFNHISKIIENRKTGAADYTNQEVNLMFWEIGHYINSVILDFKRASYGKGIFSTLSRKLAKKYDLAKAEIAFIESMIRPMEVDIDA